MSSLGSVPGLRYLVRTSRDLRKGAHLVRMGRKIKSLKPGCHFCFAGYTVKFNDGPNLYILYKDIFVNGIYHFDAARPDPLILDCGSNIGMSILYFKQKYLSRDAEKKIFFSDGICGSGLAETLTREKSHAWKQYEVPCMRLRDYLHEPVDFLKMNMEGAEYEVLADSEDRLRQIREMVIEYHHLPEQPRSLHHILELLHNDFDSETNGGVQPPFRLTPESHDFLLVYAKRTD